MSFSERYNRAKADHQEAMEQQKAREAAEAAEQTKKKQDYQHFLTSLQEQVSLKVHELVYSNPIFLEATKPMHDPEIKEALQFLIDLDGIDGQKQSLKWQGHQIKEFDLQMWLVHTFPSPNTVEITDQLVLELAKQHAEHFFKSFYGIYVDIYSNSHKRTKQILRYRFWIKDGVRIVIEEHFTSEPRAQGNDCVHRQSYENMNVFLDHMATSLADGSYERLMKEPK